MLKLFLKSFYLILLQETFFISGEMALYTFERESVEVKPTLNWMTCMYVRITDCMLSSTNRLNIFNEDLFFSFIRKFSILLLYFKQHSWTKVSIPIANPLAIMIFWPWKLEISFSTFSFPYLEGFLVPTTAIIRCCKDMIPLKYKVN